MRKITILLIVLSFFSFKNSRSQCVLVPLSLQERVEASTLIVEAMVSSKTSYWNQEQSMIYTASTLLVSKVYKGSGLLQGQSVSLITLGGRVGMKAIKVDPELETEIGEIGIFMLISKNGEWVSESGPQGIIRIDKQTAEASDIFNTYPAFSIEKTITDLTQISPVNINELLTKIKFSNKRAFPTISSISPSTITAGTSSVLTIKGTNFETTRDTNSVQFRNADNGGTGFVKAMKYDYISWTDTMIKVMVRTTAGTGKIRVVVGGTGSVNSTDTLKVTYAHLNVVSGDSIGFETQEVGMNLANGITWKMNKRFYDSAGARGAFCRSLERWRCGTFINWDTLGRVNYSAIKPDGVNICAWDTNGIMPNGVLAQCFSYWSGCFTPGLKWFVNELDIRFAIKPTASTHWNYTTGNANSNQFHFESVATHELGHGHQMGHVINSPVVMHFSIANGQTKPALSANDISAGNYVIGKSATAICGKNSHSKLNSGNCAMVVTKANFTHNKNSVCLGEFITFTDSSQGNITAYSWDFGAGAVPATANTVGPHNVRWTTGGSKTVTLTITTIVGNLVKTKNVSISNDQNVGATFDFALGGKGRVTFTNTSKNPSTSKWYFGDGDSSALTAPVHDYDTGGTYFVTLKASNSCSNEMSIKGIDLAWLNFYTPKTSACINEPVLYLDSSDNRVAIWQWAFTGGTPATASGKGPHYVSYNSPGNKSVSLAISNTKGSNQLYTRSNIISISNDTFTKASFKFGYYGKNMVGFENTSGGSGMTYKWYFGDGDSSTLKNPIHQYSNANNKNVTLIVKGNCGTHDTTIQLRDFTSLVPVSGNQVIKLFPNPVDKEVFIKSLPGTALLVQLFDLTGKIVLESELAAGETLSTENVENGVYILKLANENLHETFRLVVQH